MSNPVQLRRDPFARITLYRTVYSRRTYCQWCGEYKDRLYFYYWQDDNGRGGTNKDSGPFCNINCYEAYQR